MIIVYSPDTQFKPCIITHDNQELLQSALWIDLLIPTPEELHLTELVTELEIPSRTEMQEIEFSSRFYESKNAIFMTVDVISKSDSANPMTDPVTLIVTEHQLITLRYIEPQSFLLLISKLMKSELHKNTPQTLLIELLETAIDRLADILEKVGLRLDQYSQQIFRPELDPEKDKLDYKSLLQSTGALGDLNTQARESLISFQRLVSFFKQHSSAQLDSKTDSQLLTLLKDIASLNDYANFISNKISFLLSATLGLVNIEQNNTIKIFSVAAVIFLPPTLIASMYGMNFHIIPELSWKYGYPYAIFLMLLSGLFPYLYFKQKKWL